MNKFLLKTHFGALLTVCALAFGFSLTEASAQLVNPAKTIQGAKVDWVDSSDAMTRLGQEIAALEAFLQGKSGDPLDYKLKYYILIHQSIESGETVPRSIDLNYMRFVAGFTDDPVVEIPNNLPVSIWQSYYTNAVDLLQK
jgi:hypothetical protein